MQVDRVELAQRLEPFPIVHGQARPREGDQAGGPHGLLQGAVHMHGGDAERVADLRLGERPRVVVVAAKADRAHAGHHLAEEVGQTAVGLFAPDPEHPLAEDRPIDQRLTPERSGQTGVADAEVVENLMLDEPDLAARDRGERVVHGPDVQALEVGDLAGNMEGVNLALACFRHAVAAGIALDQQTRARGAVALADDVLIGADVLHLHGHALERRPLLVREGDDALHLGEERMGVRMQGVHDAAPYVEAGARWSLSHRRLRLVAGNQISLSHNAVGADNTGWI